ncbi:MAG TPA: fumarylacetoacetase [Acidimicrobiia bacterium]|nr:fumarylacetoacetase [Acidimicrobiia bacterium]
MNAFEPWPPAPAGSPFGVANLPYGVFSHPAVAGGARRVGVAVGEHVLDLAPVLDDPAFAAPSLDAFLARGRAVWSETRARLTELLTDGHYRGAVVPHLRRRSEVSLHRPFTVGDYVDFYCSLDHASNVGRIFRPDAEPLLPNWRHLPVGYHGRSGTVVVSGTPVVRPCGQRRPPGTEAPSFGPSVRLDIEAEVGFVVGVGSPLGEPVPVEAFADHVFGVVLVNDWSARDIQAWEYQPLGPFLGKSFATSISPWVVPLEALAAARVDGPVQDPAPLPYLRRAEPWGLDLSIEVALNGAVVSRPPFATMYWTPDQMLAHLTVNGASTRPGDLYASGTVSGPEPGQRGSLIELTWNGAEPLTLPDGSTRAFLEDGDTVTISATAPAPGGGTLGLGAVTGTILPARPPA